MVSRDNESALRGSSAAISGTTLPPWSPRRCWDGYTWSATNYNITWGREFRYDSGREKYLVRELDPDALLQPGGGSVVADSEVWSDYEGAEIYGDYAVTGGSATDIMSYEPGIGWHLWSGGVPLADGEEYHHADHLGTLRRTSDDAGAAGASRVFTAFGELMAGPEDRFGYVGAWGYQRDPDFAFLHVGARWYDPATGRFLQRDPNGIGGGVNVYEYAMSSPLYLVDPDGRGPVDWLWGKLPLGFHRVMACGGQLPFLDPGDAQTWTLRIANVVSVAAPVGAGYKTVTATAKTVRALKGSRIGRAIQKIRQVIRKDPPHHGRPPEWDGTFPNWWRKKRGS